MRDLRIFLTDFLAVEGDDVIDVARSSGRGVGGKVEGDFLAFSILEGDFRFKSFSLLKGVGNVA